MSVAAVGAPVPGLLQRLGYPPDKRLIITHGDDLGQTHAINRATLGALEAGTIVNASILVPCPWVAEVVEWARRHPDADLGIQMTLTSEQLNVRWGPILGAARVPSLVDAQGYFPASGAEFGSRVKPEEAEAEMRAQLARLRALGIAPTYMDSHMGTAFKTPALFAAYLRIAHEAHIPALVTKDMVAPGNPLAALVGPNDVVVDRKLGINAKVAPGEWASHYDKLLRSLGPGVYFLEFHLAHDDLEQRAAHGGKDAYGAAWRQRDFDFVSGPFRKLLGDAGLGVVTWREIGKRAGLTGLKVNAGR